MTRRFEAPDHEIEDLIQRSSRAGLSRDEAARLAEWRTASLANEQHYRRSIRLLGAIAAQGTADRRPPSVHELLARPRDTTLPPLRTSGLTRPRVWIAAAVALAIAGTVYGAHRGADGSLATSRADLPLADGVGYSTGASEMATVQLSDGSVVRLAPNSRLRFAQRPTMREAILEGRAYFSVAKIPVRPFHVHTRLGDVTVLGTQFELATESSDLKLLVVSGRVGLAGRANQLEVHAGESSAVHDGTVAEPTRLPNAATMSRWVGKFLAFQSTPMPEVAREIEETYGVRVVARDSAISNRTVTGVFTDRDVRDVIDAVCAVVNAQCVTRGSDVVMTNP